MIKNYIIIAIRSFRRQKILAAINIIGLSLGLACLILFLTYSLHEFSFEHMHQDADQIYRVYRWTKDIHGRGNEGDPHLPMPLAQAMAEDLPDVVEVLRWKEAWGENFVRINGEINRVEISHVDPNLFTFFDFPLKYGEPESALLRLSSVVLTEETSQKLFGESNSIGKVIEIQIEDEFIPFTVSAIAQNIPSNSSKRFQIVGNFLYFEQTAYGKRRANSWFNSFLTVFVKLREGSGLASNEDALLQFRRKYYPNEEAELRAEGYWTGDGAPVTYRLQPVREMHLNTEIGGSEVPAINPANIWMLLLIAGGVLLIAIINFTTLSIGRSANRAQEVGIRKVLGCNKPKLIFQFLFESLLLTLLATIMAVGLTHGLLPYFNELSGREMSISLSDYPQLPWLLVGTVIISSVLAGSYPALVLSNFEPVKVLQKKIRLGGSNYFTKSLMMVQFTLSSGLIIATGIILAQVDFMQSRHPGFDKENVLVIDAEGTDTKTIYPRIRDELLTTPMILGMASSDLGLGEGNGWSRSGFDYHGQHKEIYEYYVDDDYLSVMGMKLLTGRDFGPDYQDGANRSVIINQAMARDFGWTPTEALGQELTGYSRNGPQPKVIGVVNDFNFRPLKEDIQPQMFHQFEDYQPFKFFVRIQAGNQAQVLSRIDEVWNQVVPGFPLKINFLDEELDRFYRSEQRLGKIIGWAGGISIFLAGLGLLGLAFLAGINRSKEISIRRVLGATMVNVIQLLSKDFVRLIGLSFLVAIPIVWLLMDKWLTDFAFHINMPWWIYLVVCMGTILLAIATISLQSIQSIVRNPIESLRTE